MAKKDGEQKRKRSRKARTAGDDSSSTAAAAQNTVSVEDGPSSQQDNKIEDSTEPTTEKVTTENDDFSDYYLRKVTMELQEDLDKVRSAGDFTDSSLPILITALRQGEVLFSEEEKKSIMGKRQL